MAEISATIKINDAFSGALDKLSAGLSKGQSGFSRLKSALSGDSFGDATKSSNGFFKSMLGANLVGSAVTKGMGLAGNGIRSMLTELDESSKAWQTFEGNMNQIGASKGQINVAKADMQKFAQQTIYSAADMASTYAQLSAVGTKNTGKLVKGFGGLAAASDNPAQAMKTLSEQATQMAAKPKVQWQDFKLMLEQTPAGMSAVAKTMHKSTTELIKDIQDGNVKTQDFLNAVAKTGTNANFSKMATQYKTVGQAMDGLKETVANGLISQYQKLSNIGIKAVSGITDKLGNLNWDALGDGLVSAVNKIEPIINNLGKGFKQMFEGFSDSGAGKSIVDMFNSIADAGKKLTGTLSKGKGGNSFFKQLGELGGGALSTVANAISGVADAIGKMDPNTLMTLGRAFIMLKGGLKGIAFMAVVKALQQLNKLSPGTIENIASSLTKLAYALVLMKAVGKGIKMFKGFKDMFGAFKTPKMPEMPKTPTAPKSGGILQSAGAFMKLGAALLMVGASVALVAVGFKLLTNAATQLAAGGGAAIAVFFGMVAAIAALAIVVRLLGPGMMSASVGFLMFAGALLLIGASIFIASAGLALLATQLPVIAQYGTSAAVGILALAGAVAVFGLAAVVGAVGILLLTVALVAFAVGLVVATVGLMLFAVGLTLIAAMAMVAAVGILLLGVGMALVAAMVLIAAVGMIMLGVGLVLVATLGLVAAMGMLMLSMALILIGPMSMIAAVGMLLLDAALMVVGAGLMVVAAAAMAAAVALMAIGVSIMMLATMFITAGAMMISAITSAMNGVVNAVRSGVQNAVNAARSFAGALVGVGRDLIQGLINGITSMIGAAVSAVSKVASSVVSAAKGLLHIGSPSRLFRKFGRWTDEGFIIGLNEYAGKVANSAQNMVGGVIDAADGLGTTEVSPISLVGDNPGDMLAAGFDRALESIATVAGAVTRLNGAQANIGIMGQGSISSSGIDIPNNSVASGSLTPNSLSTTSNSSTTQSSQEINIQPGAIVVQSNGNPDYDVDQMLEAFENKIFEKGEKVL